MISLEVFLQAITYAEVLQQSRTDLLDKYWYAFVLNKNSKTVGILKKTHLFRSDLSRENDTRASFETRLRYLIDNQGEIFELLKTDLLKIYVVTIQSTNLVLLKSREKARERKINFMRYIIKL